MPAKRNVIVQAEKADQTDASIMLLTYSNAGGKHYDELSTYRNLDQYGVTGGAFGAMGGSSHTVLLCPLQAVDPTGQNHGECASFAYVNTHTVGGLVWKNVVLRSEEDANDDRFSFGLNADGDHVYGDPDHPTFVSDIEVSLSPVEGKNLAGDTESFTTKDKEVEDNDHPDDTHHFEFPNIAAGVYTFEYPDGWRARLGAGLTKPEIKGSGGTASAVNGALNPLGGDVGIDVTTATTTVYGYVRDSEDYPVEDVTVMVNGVKAVTDVHGRYIAEYVGPGTAKKPIAVTTSHEDNKATEDLADFTANDRIHVDVELDGVSETGSVSGTVTASDSGAPIRGVSILVDGAAPDNADTDGANAGKLVTGDGGTYMATFAAKDVGETVEVSVEADGWSFVPAVQTIPGHDVDIEGINFTGFRHATISGRVRGPDGLGGVTVTATNVVSTTPTPVESTSNARGTFVLSVPFGTYEIEASKEDYTFAYPATGQTVSVAPDQDLDFGTIQAMTYGNRNVTASWVVTVDDPDTDAVEPTTVTANVSVGYVRDDDAIPEGYDDIAHAIQTKVGDAAWAVATVLNNPGDTESPDTISGAPDGAFMVRIVSTITDTDQSGFEADGTTPANLPTDSIVSNVATVAAIDPSASNVTAVRGIRDPDGTPADTVGVSWSATTTTRRWEPRCG